MWQFRSRVPVTGSPRSSDWIYGSCVCPHVRLGLSRAGAMGQRSAVVAHNTRVRGTDGRSGRDLRGLLSPAVRSGLLTTTSGRLDAVHRRARVRGSRGRAALHAARGRQPSSGCSVWDRRPDGGRHGVQRRRRARTAPTLSWMLGGNSSRCRPWLQCERASMRRQMRAAAEGPRGDRTLEPPESDPGVARGGSAVPAGLVPAYRSWCGSRSSPSCSSSRSSYSWSGLPIVSTRPSPTCACTCDVSTSLIWCPGIGAVPDPRIATALRSTGLDAFLDEFRDSAARLTAGRAVPRAGTALRTPRGPRRAHASRPASS